MTTGPCSASSLSSLLLPRPAAPAAGVYCTRRRFTLVERCLVEYTRPRDARMRLAGAGLKRGLAAAEAGARYCGIALPPLLALLALLALPVLAEAAGVPAPRGDVGAAGTFLDAGLLCAALSPACTTSSQARSLIVPDLRRCWQQRQQQQQQPHIPRQTSDVRRSVSDAVVW